MFVNMVTRPVYKKKEVGTLLNKMKHISPLQRHVFLPLTCRILKGNHNFSPFLSWLTEDTKAIKLHLRNITMSKDDQWGTRNPYKCMNIMKQDAMDDKITERWKTCEKQCMQEDLDKSRSYRAEANLDGSNSYRANKKFLDGLRICREAIEIKSRKFDGSRLH